MMLDCYAPELGATLRGQTVSVSVPIAGMEASTPPLEALHDMTERKRPLLDSVAEMQAAYLNSLQSTPHGITDILGRKLAAAAAQGHPFPVLPFLTTDGRQQLPPQRQQGGGFELPTAQMLCVAGWPRIKDNISADRNSPDFLSDKILSDNRKKHTRPTFSGQQVWFQNRRTKWRKKHAAEMVTAKRRHEDTSDMEDDQSMTTANTMGQVMTSSGQYEPSSGSDGIASPEVVGVMGGVACGGGGGGGVACGGGGVFPNRPLAGYLASIQPHQLGKNLFPGGMGTSPTSHIAPHMHHQPNVPLTNLGQQLTLPHVINPVSLSTINNNNNHNNNHHNNHHNNHDNSPPLQYMAAPANMIIAAPTMLNTPTAMMNTPTNMIGTPTNMIGTPTNMIGTPTNMMPILQFPQQIQTHHRINNDFIDY